MRCSTMSLRLAVVLERNEAVRQLHGDGLSSCYCPFALGGFCCEWSQEAYAELGGRAGCQLG